MKINPALAEPRTQHQSQNVRDERAVVLQRRTLEILYQEHKYRKRLHKSDGL